MHVVLTIIYIKQKDFFNALSVKTLNIIPSLCHYLSILIILIQIMHYFLIETKNQENAYASLIIKRNIMHMLMFPCVHLNDMYT